MLHKLSDAALLAHLSERVQEGLTQFFGENPDFAQSREAREAAIRAYSKAIGDAYGIKTSVLFSEEATRPVEARFVPDPAPEEPHGSVAFGYPDRRTVTSEQFGRDVVAVMEDGIAEMFEQNPQWTTPTASEQRVTAAFLGGVSHALYKLFHLTMVPQVNGDLLLLIDHHAPHQIVGVHES